MSNLRMAGGNCVDDERCVLACSVTDILPVENLQDRSRGKILRVAVAATVEVTGTYGGEDIAASFVSALRHNWTGDSTFRFRGYADPATTTQTIDTGTRSAVPTAFLEGIDFGIGELGVNVFSPNYREKRTTIWFDDADMVQFDTPVMQSWKVTYGDVLNPFGYLDLSRLWLGEHHEFASNPVWGSSFGWVDESQTWRTDGGGARTDAALPYRSGKLDCQLMPEADRAYMMALMQFCGAGRRTFFLSLFPELLGSNDQAGALIAAHEGEMIFKGPLPQLVHNEASGGRYNATVNIEEV
jgi:hypothetical protein